MSVAVGEIMSVEGFVEYGRIRPRRQTRLCAKEQRAMAVAVKRARHLALLPFVDE